MRDLIFSTLTPEDVMQIQAQPSQLTVFGQRAETHWEDACAMADASIAWAVRKNGRLIACFGIVEHFPGMHGLAWALLAEGIGEGHLQLTRFMQGQIAACGLARLELLARGPDLERELAQFPDLDSGQIVALAMRRATREMRWAVLLGLKPAHLLRCHGAAGESYMLFERLRPAQQLVAIREEAA